MGPHDRIRTFALSITGFVLVFLCTCGIATALPPNEKVAYSDVIKDAPTSPKPPSLEPSTVESVGIADVDSLVTNPLNPQVAPAAVSDVREVHSQTKTAISTASSPVESRGFGPLFKISLVSPSPSLSSRARNGEQSQTHSSLHRSIVASAHFRVFVSTPFQRRQPKLFIPWPLSSLFKSVNTDSVAVPVLILLVNEMAPAPSACPLPRNPKSSAPFSSFSPSDSRIDANSNTTVTQYIVFVDAESSTELFRFRAPSPSDLPQTTTSSSSSSSSPRSSSPVVKVTYPSQQLGYIPAVSVEATSSPSCPKETSTATVTSIDAKSNLRTAVVRLSIIRHFNSGIYFQLMAPSKPFPFYLLPHPYPFSFRFFRSSSAIPMAPWLCSLCTPSGSLPPKPGSRPTTLVLLLRMQLH